MSNLLIDPAEAVPELAVVVSERQQRTDSSPQELFNEKMAATLFPNHPYGRPVIGVGARPRADYAAQATAFYHRHYAPNNAILVVSGSVGWPRLQSLVLQHAGACLEPTAASAVFPCTTSTSRRPSASNNRCAGHIAFVVQRLIVPANDYALEVLSEVLAAQEVGLLYRHFVMDRKIASGIDASYDSLAL